MQRFTTDKNIDVYTVNPPSCWYWLKAGAAFTLGAGIVTFASAVAWLWLLSRAPELVALRALMR